MKKRVLIFTDSRGQHTPSGSPMHDVFATRLANHPDIDATLVMCPQKWTTTLDFFAYLDAHADEKYDHIILQTGIVEWSPRPQNSAINDLYNNPAPSNLENEGLNTRDYSLKIINNKKSMFDEAFGEAGIQDYLNTDFGVPFEGQPTVNMYGLDQAKTGILPRLQAMDNLIFINSNRFVKGWAGDHARGRPDNISITEAYSKLFRDTLGAAKVIDLLSWTDADIQRYTCDNIHFTRLGSDWIFQELCDRMGVGQAGFKMLGRAVEAPRIMSEAERADTLAKVGRAPSDKLATLVIGFRFPEYAPVRMENMMLLLDWIDDHYADLFDVLLVEQDVESKIDRIVDRLRPYVRHEFLFNPSDYNRGWGYNVAVNQMTEEDVIALMDTDVLTGANFVQEIIDCFEKYKAVSPYANVYFTNAEEADEFRKTAHLDHMTRADGVTKPTTIAGGVLIARRSAYLDLKGFEQYTSYGGEDRAFDVALMQLCAADEVRIAPSIYVHIYHAVEKVDRSQLGEILADLKANFGCYVDRNLTAASDIHENCNHAETAKLEKLLKRRAASFADPALYASGKDLTIAGHYVEAANRIGTKQVLFPEDGGDLDGYTQREIYKAPPHDEAAIASLYNKFKGERCFIIGNGPSLNKHDLSLLEGEYTFAVNSFYYKTRETGFRPTFFVVEDSSVMKENAEQIREYEAPFKFFPTNYRTFHPDADNVLFFHMNRGFYEKTSPNFCVPRFSTDASKVLYCGQSVTYINLQLAYFMGFTEVHLIGMDFDYVIPKEHEKNGDIILSTTDDPNHFHKDYFGVGKTWKDPKLERVGMNYRQAKLAYEAVGRKIYNATIGGKLEIFERSDYDALFTGDALPAKTPPVEPQPVKRGLPKPAPAVQAAPPPRVTAKAIPIAEKPRPPIAPVEASVATQKVSPDASIIALMAHKLRDRSPHIFLAMRTVWRMVRTVLARPRLLVLLAGFGLISIVALWLLPPTLKIGMLTLGGLTLLGGVIAFVAARARNHIAMLSAETRQLRSSLKMLGEEQNASARELANTLQQEMRQKFAQQNRQHKDASIEIKHFHSVLNQMSEEVSGRSDRLKEFESLTSIVESMQASLSAAIDDLGKLSNAQAVIESGLSRVSEQTAQLPALSEQQTSIEASLSALSREQEKQAGEALSFDLVSALRALRPTWLGVSEVDRLSQEPNPEHGHYLLMSILSDEEFESPGGLRGKTLIEIGSSRELIHTQRSTQKLGIYTALLGMNLVTVDMDPLNTKAAAALLERINPAAKAINDKGENYLGKHVGDIDYVYLDAFDFSHGGHSEVRKESYRENLGTDITDEACRKMHLQCAQHLAARMKTGGLIVLDDTWRGEGGQFEGKGYTAMPLLLECGFDIVVETPKTVALRRTSMPGAARSLKEAVPGRRTPPRSRKRSSGGAKSKSS